MSEIRCYVYNQIPGAHPSWSLAVLATSRQDADHYVRTYNGGGVFAYQPAPGTKVQASCGAVTWAAEKILEERIAY
jgi:hypothetical protein